MFTKEVLEQYGCGHIEFDKLPEKVQGAITAYHKITTEVIPGITGSAQAQANISTSLIQKVHTEIAVSALHEVSAYIRTLTREALLDGAKEGVNNGTN